MTTYRNSLEGGETNTVITVDNSGADSGDAFGQVTTTGGSASQARFHASAAYQGSLGMRFVLNASANSARGYESAPGSRGGLEGMLWWPGAPAATTTIGRIDNGASSALCYLHARTELSGSLRVGNSSNGTIAASAIAIPSPGTARWLRVGLYATPHATTGRVELYVDEANGTAIGSYDSGATLANVGSTNPERFRFGDATSTSGWTNLDWDNVMWGAIASGRHSFSVGRLTTDKATAEPGDVVTLDASTSTGTITSITQNGGDAVPVVLHGTGNTRRFWVPYTAAGATFNFTVTVSGGEPGSVSVTGLRATERLFSGGSTVPARLTQMPRLDRLGKLSDVQPTVVTSAAADGSYNVPYVISGGAYPVGWPIDLGPGVSQIVSNYSYSSPLAQARMLRFTCTGSKIALRTNSVTPFDSFLLFINGKPWKHELTPFGNGATFTTIDFGSAATRLIEVLTTAGIQAVYTNAPGTCTLPATLAGAKGLLVGDSYAAGVTLNGADTTESPRMNGFAPRLGLELGLDRWITDGIGGTGFLKTSGAGTNNLNDRRAAHIALAPDLLVVVGGGSNDLFGGAFTVGQVITAATTYFTQVRAALPSCRLVFVEGFAPPNGYSGFNDEYSAIRAGLQTALEAVGVYYVDVATSSPWINGTGWVGATTGVGNSDTFVGGDGIHLTIAGHLHVRELLAERLITIMGDGGVLLNELV